MTSVPRLYLHGVGVAAPGLPDWSSALPVLRGETDYLANALAPHAPQRLPVNERRRASRSVVLAFRAAEQAVVGADAGALATVFCSADGDQYITQRICQELAGPIRMVSPTDFHNSVHNAPAGNWSIAVGGRGPSTAIAAWHGGFACGLLEAAGMAIAEAREVLLVSYDLPAPAELGARSLSQREFASALRLGPRAAEGTLAQFELTREAGAESICDSAELEALRQANPAARCLPLLQHLARRRDGELHLPELRGPGARLRLSFPGGSG